MKKAREVALSILNHQLDCMGYWTEMQMLDKQGCSDEEIRRTSQFKKLLNKDVMNAILLKF